MDSLELTNLTRAFAQVPLPSNVGGGMDHRSKDSLSRSPGTEEASGSLGFKARYQDIMQTDPATIVVKDLLDNVHASIESFHATNKNCLRSAKDDVKWKPAQYVLKDMRTNYYDLHCWIALAELKVKYERDTCLKRPPGWWWKMAGRISDFVTSTCTEGALIADLSIAACASYGETEATAPLTTSSPYTGSGTTLLFETQSPVIVDDSTEVNTSSVPTWWIVPGLVFVSGAFSKLKDKAEAAAAQIEQDCADAERVVALSSVLLEMKARIRLWRKYHLINLKNSDLTTRQVRRIKSAISGLKQYAGKKDLLLKLTENKMTEGQVISGKFEGTFKLRSAEKSDLFRARNEKVCSLGNGCAVSPLHAREIVTLADLLQMDKDIKNQKDQTTRLIDGIRKVTKENDAKKANYSFELRGLKAIYDNLASILIRLEIIPQEDLEFTNGNRCIKSVIQGGLEVCSLLSSVAGQYLDTTDGEDKNADIDIAMKITGLSVFTVAYVFSRYRDYNNGTSSVDRQKLPEVTRLKQVIKRELEEVSLWVDIAAKHEIYRKVKEEDDKGRMDAFNKVLKATRAAKRRGINPKSLAKINQQVRAIQINLSLTAEADYKCRKPSVRSSYLQRIKKVTNEMIQKKRTERQSKEGKQQQEDVLLYDKYSRSQSRLQMCRASSCKVSLTDMDVFLPKMASQTAAEVSSNRENKIVPYSPSRVASGLESKTHSRDANSPLSAFPLSEDVESGEGGHRRVSPIKGGTDLAIISSSDVYNDPSLGWEFNFEEEQEASVIQNSRSLGSGESFPSDSSVLPKPSYSGLSSASGTEGDFDKDASTFAEKNRSYIDVANDSILVFNKNKKSRKSLETGDLLSSSSAKDKSSSISQRKNRRLNIWERYEVEDMYKGARNRVGTMFNSVYGYGDPLAPSEEESESEEETRMTLREHESSAYAEEEVQSGEETRMTLREHESSAYAEEEVQSGEETRMTLREHESSAYAEEEVQSGEETRMTLREHESSAYAEEEVQSGEETRMTLREHESSAYAEEEVQSGEETRMTLREHESSAYAEEEVQSGEETRMTLREHESSEFAKVEVDDSVYVIVEDPNKLAVDGEK